MIAHIDADAFFASVLQRADPKLRGKPLLTTGMGHTCVIAASYEAKKLGVKTGMHIRDARKLAPHAISMPADFTATARARQEFFDVLEKFCPGGVEKTSVDEGYLDMRNAKCHPERSRGMTHAPRFDSAQRDTLDTFATTLQTAVHRYLDLPVSIGIAPSKTLAKMGSKHNKPRGICIIEKEHIKAFLREKSIDAISGIGYRLGPKMQSRGYDTALDLAHADPMIIEKILGKRGLELRQELQGIPVFPVVIEPDPPKSISRCRSFRRTSNRDFLYAQTIVHLQRCSTKLRRHKFECGRLGVWLYRAGDTQSNAVGFEHTYRERRVFTERILGRYLSEEALLLPFLCDCFSELYQKDMEYMQTGLVLSDFKLRGSRQRSLFETHNLERVAALQDAMDSARGKFGRDCVQYGPAIAN